MARTAWLAAVLAAVALAPAAARAQAPQDANGRAAVTGGDPVTILLEMEKTYAGCKSYRDTGRVTSLILTDGGRAGGEKPFATAFVRPGRFRFQFTDTGLGGDAAKYIVWSDGNEVLSWWDRQPGVRHPGSLEDALAPAAEISGGVSVRVPALLLPQSLGRGPLLVAPQRLEDEADRGVTCVRIEGKGRKTPYLLPSGPNRSVQVLDETFTLWIDKATHLLRKVEQRRTMETYRSESTTTYTPEINVEVPAADLAFGAPAAPAEK